MEWKSGWAMPAFAVMLLGIALEGCSTRGAMSGVTQATPKTATCVPDATWVAPADRSIRTRAEVLHRAAAGRFVLLGEMHDNMMHHAWQLDVLSSLYTSRPALVIGMEMLPRSAQPALDAWVRGELDEETFLSQSGWREYWRFDSQLYMPILRFARLNRIPVYGLNVDKTLVASVRERGWAALRPDERAGLGNPVTPSAAYRDMLAGTFAMHGANRNHGEMAALDKVRADPAFDRFVDAQLLWDRAMAERLALAAREHSDALVVGITGSGHMMGGDGVPFQLSYVDASTLTVLLPWDSSFGCDDVTTGLADVVYGVAALPIADNTARPRLGVRIEAASGGGVRVVEVVSGSVAQAAGFAADDVLLSAAGTQFRTPEDVINVVQRVLPGSWLPVTVRRGDANTELVAKFPVTPP